MTWQDELRQLDEELAAGRMSAEDYRRQRDDLLARTASSGRGAPVTPPRGQPEAAAPFPPPFRWNDEAAPEVTQVMSPIRDEPAGDKADKASTEAVAEQGVGSGDGNAETTQVVRRPQGDPDRTQVVPGTAAAAPPRHEAHQPLQAPQPHQHEPPLWQRQQPPPAHQQQPPHQQPGGHAPPWAGMDLPPAETTPSWFKQGPESFDQGGGAGRARTIGMVAAVLAIVLVAGGIVFFVVRNYQGNQGTPGAQTTTSASATQTSEPRLLGDLAGEIDKNSTGPTRLERARGMQFSPEEGDLMATCGADAGEVQVLYRGFWYTQVHVFGCTDTAKAETAARALLKLQERYGFGQRSAVNGLPVVQLDNATDVPDVPVVSRSFYVSGSDLVRVEVRGKTPQDVTQGMDEVTEALAEKYPAG